MVVKYLEKNMEVGGYEPVNMIPTPERAGEVATAAAVVREGAANIVGAEKQQERNEQQLQRATSELRGLRASSSVDLMARAVVEFAAADSSVRAWHENVKAGVSGALAGACEAVSRVVVDLKLDQWGRSVDIATQRASAKELAMGAMGETLKSQLPDARAIVPELAKSLFDRAADFFRRDNGKRRAAADQMRTRAKDIRETKSARPMSAELSATVEQLRAQATEQASRIAQLEMLVQQTRSEAGVAARVVGGTSLEQKVTKVPFGQ